MDYEQTVNKIHSFGKFGSRLGLERMKILMDLLNNPQDQLKIIHVAGTNGKGSVCRFLATALHENGYKVGIYTSPFLENFTERIEFDGKEIAKEELVSCSQQVFKAVDKMIAMGHESPTEFELVTAIGFLYYSQKPIDILILEVGLGGIGDSTNLIKKPLVTVFTSISYDHMDVLGETIEEIAYQKAGIIKPACPVVSNVKDRRASEVIRNVALENKCDFYDSSEIEIDVIETSLKGSTFIPGPLPPINSLMLGRGEPIEIGMVGAHQIENAVCALTVLEVLNKKSIIKLDLGKVKYGFKITKFMGRFEILQNSPYIIIDGAHNEAGVHALSQIVNDNLSDKKVLLVVGMLADKKIDRLLAEYNEIDGDILASEPDSPRKLDADILCQMIKDTGRDCICGGNWLDVCKYVDNIKTNYDAIIFSGSLYFIGKVRKYFR
jgi:dihydrofolate synthase/folylpolyglutamate synthase